MGWYGLPMPGAIVFISRNRVLPGMLDGVRAFLAAGSPMIESSKPRTLAFLPYLDEAGEELTIVHVFADADAFDAHLAGADERSSAAYEFIAPLGFELYGPASEAAVAMFRAAAEAGDLVFDHAPDLPAGFLRAG